jgi:hypothetical protein
MELPVSPLPRSSNQGRVGCRNAEKKKHMNDTLSDSALALAEAYYDVMERDRATLEALVDKHGFNAAIELLEEVCASRAKLALRHGNQSVADTWYRAAVALDKARGIAPLF